MNGRAKACEKYPSKFCKVDLNAMRKDLGALMSLDCDVRGAIGVHADEPAGETSRATSRNHIDVTQEFEALMVAMDSIEKTESINGVEEMDSMAQETDSLYVNYDFIDDISGKDLDKALAIEARQK